MLNRTDIVEIKEKLINNASKEDQQNLITHLIAEFVLIITEKEKLENENASLKLECFELKQKLVNNETQINSEKFCLMEDIRRSQERLQEKEVALVKKDALYLEERKQCLKEINSLRIAYHTQNEMCKKKEADLLDKLKLLQLKSQDTYDAYKTANNLANHLMGKCVKYKIKVKRAVNVIKNLTESLEKYNRKSEMHNVECQTVLTISENFTSRCSLRSQPDFSNENIVLTDLFFKESPYNGELETFFINNCCN